MRPAAAIATAARILVVDDSHAAADTVALLLQLEGHVLEVAYDGQEALQAAERFRPDIMVLDLGLPRLDGREVARKIRTLDWAAGVHLIALTGRSEASERKLSLEAGFHQFLVKPVDPDRLIRLVAEAYASR